ncbi:hypothetical protein Ciccas_006821 [Cichlidogyrus casuarinus]|uniref:Leucine-rich repeat-containing protein 71-like n=1 Tax=Cichlidogyrus casuarinus TaxID=1844966 RepID=A0ABD2Q4Q8_9PLAT
MQSDLFADEHNNFLSPPSSRKEQNRPGSVKSPKRLDKSAVSKTKKEDKTPNQPPVKNKKEASSDKTSPTAKKDSKGIKNAAPKGAGRTSKMGKTKELADALEIHTEQIPMECILILTKYPKLIFVKLHSTILQIDETVATPTHTLLMKCKYVEPVGLQMEGNKTLIFLNLSRNRITEKGLVQINEVLEKQTEELSESGKSGLKKLLLGGNQLGDASPEMIRFIALMNAELQSKNESENQSPELKS